MIIPYLARGEVDIHRVIEPRDTRWSRSNEYTDSADGRSHDAHRKEPRAIHGACLFGSVAHRVDVSSPSRTGAPITFEAAPGEEVFISAAEPVTGWQRHEGSIYTAPMPWSMGRRDRDQVFVDGEVMYRARTPNVEGPCPRDEKYENSTATRSRCLLDRQDRCARSGCLRIR
jgi:hypothetical protein